MRNSTPRRKGHEQEPQAKVQPLHILLVENHPDTRSGMVAFLELLGHRTVPSEDKTSALARGAEQRFDLLLSDISLPDGDGWELLQTLEARNQRPTHAIAMSGLGDPVNCAKSESVGFELHLVKPFRPEDLAAALEGLAKPSLVTQSATKVAVGKRLTATGLKQILHDGICQQLAAAALLQGSLTRTLEALAQGSGGEAAKQLPEIVENSQRINQLIDDTLAEAVALMRRAS